MILYNYVESNFAFWHSGIGDEDCLPDIHINLWIDYKNHNTYIDFGICFKCGTKFDKYFLYVPFHFDSGSIKDLFECFKDDYLLKGIFNKSCNIKQKEKSYIDIFIEGQAQRILPLNQMDLTYEECEIGTKMCFNINHMADVLQHRNIYIRWRMTYETFSKIVRKEHLGNYLLSITNPFISNDWKWFWGFNEVRHLPLSTKKEANTDKKYFRNLIFVVVCNDSIKINDMECYKVRRLEEKIYAEYKPEKYQEQGSNVYQWIKESKSHCSITIEAEVRKINWISIGIYYLIVIGTGILINIISYLLGF